MSIVCSECTNKRLINAEKRTWLKRPKNGQTVCALCFIDQFEEEIHHAIVDNRLFSYGESIAIGASGGKDSTVLAHILKVLNERYNYGIRLVLLSIDEGITGYRDESLKAVVAHQAQYELPLDILSYKDLYGWTMDEIVARIGLTNNCTFCGVFRRQALDRGAIKLGVNKLATGHNADDIAETVMMNILRGDIARLGRCTQMVTGEEGLLPRCKPLKYAYEKEIVIYARYKKLDYFSTECIYSPNSYRGRARTYIKDLEKIRPRAILDIIKSGELLAIKDSAVKQVLTKCSRCGYMSSQPICKACILLEGLNTDRPFLGIRKTKKKTETGCANDCACDSKASIVDF